MIVIQLRRLLTFAIGAGMCSASSEAFALSDLSYTIFQEGYTDGATVTGSFSGSDMDGNGLLVHFPATNGPPIEHLELTAWSMHFSGNSLAPAFDLTLDDLYGFVYEIDSSGLGDDPAFEPTLNQNLIEGIGAFDASRFYSSGLGPNGIIGGFVGGPVDFSDLGDLADHAQDVSEALVEVTPVPEPATITLLIAPGLMGCLHRRPYRRLIDPLATAGERSMSVGRPFRR
jgi:hypothetical protein